MSDSDDGFMPNNVLKYQHERTGILTQGPNRNNNNTHITSFSIRNNMMTSTFDMQNYERQRYRGAFDQRSMCYRRETTPMSLRSFPDSGIQNFHSSYYPRGMSSQRSVFNGRSGSPVSVRSMVANASVSAADIALAFKNANFNKYDLKIIKEAYSKFMRNRVRKRMEKRRHLKLLQGTRKDTGYDSGEQGSDSSISSDDCKSSRTAMYKENLQVPRQRPRSRPAKSDMTQLRNTIQESDMYQDCTENFKQDSLRNMLAVRNTQVNFSAVTNTTTAIPSNGSLVSLKDRFATDNAFVLPSQRFTRSGNRINDDISRNRTNAMQTRQAKCNFKETKNKSFESNSGNEEIFSEVTVRETVQESKLLQRKRNFDLEEANYSDTKRKKLTSPIKHPNESLISSTLINTQNKEFTFKKPQMPVRKCTKGIDTIFNDKLISKSAPPLLDDFEPDFNLHSKKRSNNKDSTLQHNLTQSVLQNKESEDINKDMEISQNITDISMKPSFIKRKLFSQKLDLLDKKNESTDNMVLNSPQTKLYAGEKHKVRKLASSQSCLNLDVLGDDNVLDLIHNIVPRDKINITNVKNKNETRKSQDEDKWDVTSVISMCNNDDVSDTYTDEETFKISHSTNNTKVNNKINNVININSETDESNKVTKEKINVMPKNKNIKTKTKPLKVILKKLSPKICNNYDQNKAITNQNKKTVSTSIKSFWDTDFESDMEERTNFTTNSKFAAGKAQENNSVVNNTINLPKKNDLKGTILTVRSTRNKGVNSSSRSDKSKVAQRTKHNDNQDNKEQIQNESKKSNCKINLNTSVIEPKNKRGRLKSNSAQKCIGKSKETCNKQKKCDAFKKNESIKIRILTPRKVNEKKRQSSPKSNQSSFNCSNISSRSLRVRKKPTNYKS